MNADSYSAAFNTIAADEQQQLQLKRSLKHYSNPKAMSRNYPQSNSDQGLRA